MMKLIAALLAAAWLTPAYAADPPIVEPPMVVSQPAPTAAEAPYLTNTSSALTAEQTIALLRQHVKYVFVLFQENRSFDSYFGSFPGARGLFSQPPEQTPGFVQPIENTDGTMATIRPFRVGPDRFSADLDDVDHGHARMAAKMNLENGQAHMDRFALEEELKYTPAGATPPLKAKQYGELAMAYEDCDTIPFLWQYASRFVLFDNFFQSTIGPSTPNAIAMIAGQTGETQWVKHPETASNTPAHAALGIGEPVVSDANPFWGSKSDTTSMQPVNPRDRPSAQLNQTYASLPLTMAGTQIKAQTSADRDPLHDLADVQQDIPAIAAHNVAALPWAWYEEGYDHEPTDPAAAPAEGSHASYIGHHNGPQYFGYIANNPKISANLHGLEDFFADMVSKKLPPSGLFFVRGGFTNLQGLVPTDPDEAVRRNFRGDDDHPGYADSQISEALLAREVNAIATSPYWPESAIVITYDESEGDYDHVAPDILVYDPAGLPLSRGPRIPLIVISPYARAHMISHESGDHNSVIKLVDRLFDLPPLAGLPDELQARLEGEHLFHQSNLGPGDDLTPGVGDLTSAFDPARLAGQAPALPPSYAAIDDQVITTLPHYANQGCHAIGIVPQDIVLGIANPIPADFNPRPSTNPSR
jgi:phospholipase C